ncbi:piggyBac transposable element-derived protein 3-like isoform X2 [Bacillus rossius redtenbacheri]|uniref:piggyBac transposable element-derived protein 3-like isoform X2 n=1 Tax=Bacillus rossius redtenbacheri TaxID=93214 RepID=UPI002FDCAA99
MERIRKINKDTVIVPPECSDDSVADDTDEDPDYSPNENRRRIYSSNNGFSSTSETETSEDEDNPTPAKDNKCYRVPSVWHDVPENMSETPIPHWNKKPEGYLISSPVDYFRYFFDVEVIDNIVTQSNLYCVQNDVNKSLNTVAQEIEQFIGTCAYMSIYSLPRSRLFWGRSTRVEKVADVMSRNRWEEFKSNLHFNDNSQCPSVTDPNRDHLFKTRPLIDSLQDRFKQIPIEEQMLCIDEQIVPFKGKSYLKQYNPNKPHKWGYKIFVLCNSKGLVHNFEVYTGCITPAEDMPDVGKSSNVVLRLIQHIVCDENYLFYFDNWYSSPALFVSLANLGFAALGTIRTNRFPGLEFSSDKEMKKRGRGAVEEKEAQIDGVPIRAIKWYDNKGVTLATT